MADIIKYFWEGSEKEDAFFLEEKTAKAFQNYILSKTGDYEVFSKRQARSEDNSYSGSLPFETYRFNNYYISWDEADEIAALFDLRVKEYEGY